MVNHVLPVILVLTNILPGQPVKSGDIAVNYE